MTREDHELLIALGDAVVGLSRAANGLPFAMPTDFQAKLDRAKSFAEVYPDVGRIAVLADPSPMALAAADAAYALQNAVIDYTNHRGERRSREIHPHRVYFGSNEWHAKKQWLLEAVDIEINEVRTFALAQIHSWAPMETK